MLQFFSASTSIVNSKRAITECLENALEGQPDLDCDLIIIYSAMGHNFKDLLTEAHKLSPNARIIGCTGAGIIGKDGPDESMKALAIMAIKGPKSEFAVTGCKTKANKHHFEICQEMAQELKSMNPAISMIQFLPASNGFWPAEKALEAIKSVFGLSIPVFGGISMPNMRDPSATGFQFFDEQVLEGGAVMIGYADPTLKFISHANHGFNIIEGMSFEVTRTGSNCIYEFNGKPAWKLLAETLGVPETTSFLQVIAIAGFARVLPEELREEYGNNYILFVIMGKNDDGSIIVPIACHDGMKIYLTKRDEKKMFEGVDWMMKKILDELNGKKPVAVFHADCVLRGRFSLDRILKDEIINHLQSPICQAEDIPWLGLYSAGEFAMLGGETLFHQMSSSLFVIYR
jgi:hypothetical protein